MQTLWDRVPVWMRLSHENILKFQGIYVDPTTASVSLVHDWGECNIISYISQGKVDRPGLVCKLLLP